MGGVVQGAVVLITCHFFACRFISCGQSLRERMDNRCISLIHSCGKRKPMFPTIVGLYTLLPTL